VPLKVNAVVPPDPVKVHDVNAPVLLKLETSNQLLPEPGYDLTFATSIFRHIVSNEEIYGL
jgi:hypothetical protein